MKRLKLIVLLSFLAISFTKCKIQDTNPGVSNDILESKKRGVFIKEYTTYTNPYKINDTLQITVIEAWLETSWYHGTNNDETIITGKPHFQLCINSIEKDLVGTTFDWTIGIDVHKNLRTSSKSSLLGDFENEPGDTIEYKVQSESNFGSDTSRNIIGKFVLIKK